MEVNNYKSKKDYFNEYKTEEYMKKYIEKTTTITSSEYIRKEIINFMRRNDFNLKITMDISTLLEEDILPKLVVVNDFSHRNCCISLSLNGYTARFDNFSGITITEAIGYCREHNITQIFLMLSRKTIHYPIC